MPTTITGLDDFPTALAVYPIALTDGRTAIACVHAPTPNTDEIAYAAAYLVSPAGVAEKIGQSEPYGKDIGCAVKLTGSTLELWVTEAEPGGGGATSRVDRYDFPLPQLWAGGWYDPAARKALKAIGDAVKSVP